MRTKSLGSVRRLRPELSGASQTFPINQRLEKKILSGASLSAIEPDDIGRRDEILAAKKPLLEAILQVLNEQRDYWPLSVRQIHYRLLNSKPLLHASKPGKYGNDKAS